MLGETHDPADKNKGIMYGVEVPSGKVLFTKALPYTVPFNWTTGLIVDKDLYDYRIGPDGFIWTFLSVGRNSVLVRIDPRDAAVHVVGKTDAIGQFVFAGNDLYMAGTTNLRRLKNIVPTDN
jgi:hypothetical protein